MSARYLTVRDLCDRYTIGKATVYRKVKLGYLPKPIHIGPGTARWPLDEVEQFEVRARADRGVQP